MAQSRSSNRGVVKVALGALLAAAGALMSATGCSAEGSGGGEQLGVVRQNIYCLNPQTGGKIDCGESTECAKVSCGGGKLGNGCLVEPISGSDGTECYTVDKEVGACVEGVCCTGCIRLNPLTRNYECEKGTTKGACGIGGKECDTCSDAPCSQSSCNTEKGACDSTPIADKEPCTDQSGVCLAGSCCRGCLDSGGTCVSGNSVNECGKTTPQSGLVECQNCDQGNTCSNYSCVTGVCAQPTPRPGACPDATICNGQETCGNSQCNPGTPLNCTDSDPCTNNSCNAQNGCTTTPNTGANCSDDNLCTITDKCAAGACTGTGVPDCDDNNPCTLDSCDAGKGCTNTPKPDNDPCDDGNECSSGDRCIAGKCLASGGKLCDDMNPCTQNTCSPASQVCSFPNENNDTPCVFDKCHQNSTCQAGSCSAGTPIVCDDANPCTQDSCDPATGCLFVADDDAECSDGDACTTDDGCDNKVCAGTAVPCAALDECHLPGTCNPGTGKCDDPRADDGTDCNEGGPGTCDTGKCVLLPVGGAGNEPGSGGAAAGGEGAEQGGNSAEGGQAEPGSGGAGNTTGTEGGAPEVPEQVFVRQPGGCSCSVPGSENQRGSAAWLAGLALAAALSRRSGGRRRAA